jgi:3',5'-cyclic-AMP phosphodiesterase
MVQIVHITDFHISSDPERIYRGVLPIQTLQKVLDRIHKSHLDSQLILATGDLVADDREAYGVVGRMLRAVGIPVYVLPGNHDSPADMRKYLAGGLINFRGSHQLDVWSIILLNSANIGQTAGKLGTNKLESLEKSLEENHDQHVLIAMHHQPIPVGSDWIDAIGLENSEDFFHIIDKHHNVKGIVFGHVHQEFDAVRGSVRLLGTPSTGMQFTPGTQNIVISNDCSAYRIINLEKNGDIKTRVVRVS